MTEYECTYKIYRRALDGSEDFIGEVITDYIDEVMHTMFSRNCRRKAHLEDDSLSCIYTDGHTEYRVFCKLRHELRACTVWEWVPETGRVWVADFVSSQIDATMRDRFNARRFPGTEKIEGLLHYADVATQTQYLVEVF